MPGTYYIHWMVDATCATQSGCVTTTLTGNQVASILGCTDPLATNYDSTANTDDGSCVYPCQTSTIDSISTNTACAGDTITIWGSNLCAPMKVHLQGWSIPDSMVLVSNSSSVVWITPVWSPQSIPAATIKLRYIDSSGVSSYSNNLAFSYSVSVVPIKVQ